MNKKTFFTDIDGTLRDYGTGIPKSAVKALEMARDNGHRAVICTGRTKCTIPSDVPLDLFTGIISGGGCRIDYMGKNLADRYLPDDIILSYGERFGSQGVPFCYETDSGIFMNRPMADIIRRIISGGGENMDFNGMGKDKIIPVENLHLFDISRHRASKISFCMTEKEFGAFSVTDSRLRLISGYDSADGFYHCELIESESGKGNGIRLYCKLTGTSIEDTAALGDSANDIDMFEAVPYSICMGNAPDDVKKYASAVTDNILEDGFYNGLCRMGII